jgi:predicted O-methyltransferase YrrM
MARAQAAEARMTAEIAPLVDVAYPSVDLQALRDPLPAIYAATELGEANEHFCRARTASESLVSAMSQALLYSLVRNLRPEHVLEIGTYRAGTAEVIARALHANGRGMLHTADPFGAYRVPAIVSRWPSELRNRLRFYPLDSMAFLSAILKDQNIRPDLVFVDGNHEYEYALFDIGCAARVLRFGGFIVIDNVSQAGPYLAARDFLAKHPDWTECRVNDRPYDPTKAYDVERSTIPYTDFMLLRAPATYSIGNRPTTFGEVALPATGFVGVKLCLGQSVGDGIIHAQCVLRGFSATNGAVEHVDSLSREVSSRDAGAMLSLPVAMDVGPGFKLARLETWLHWTGAQPLPLTAPPLPLTVPPLTH